MSPLFVNAEGRERDALADRREELERIVRLYARLLDDPGAHTSEHFSHCCDMEAAAKYLLRVLDEGGLEPFLEGFVERATRSLLQAYRLIPYEREGRA